MFEENKFMIITAGIVTVCVVALFGIIFFALPNNSLSDDEKKEFLIREDSYFVGKSDAKVEIVAFEDFQCPACASVSPDLIKIKENYSDSIKFVFRHFPLTNIHPNAVISSQAAESAGSQGKFYEYHDVLFAKQNEWSKLSGEDLLKKFEEYAVEAGVSDISKFNSDIKGEVNRGKVMRDQEDGLKLGVDATPTIYINGKKIGNPTYERLETEVNAILGK